jgi:hypothetical protein
LGGTPGAAWPESAHVSQAVPYAPLGLSTVPPPRDSWLLAKTAKEVTVHAGHQPSTLSPGGIRAVA